NDTSQHPLIPGSDWTRNVDVVPKILGCEGAVEHQHMREERIRIRGPRCTSFPRLFPGKSWRVVEDPQRNTPIGRSEDVARDVGDAIDAELFRESDSNGR